MGLWSVKCGVACVKWRVGSGLCGVQNVEGGVYSLEWNVECKV